jgi:hypothetical protein
MSSGPEFRNPQKICQVPQPDPAPPGIDHQVGEVLLLCVVEKVQVGVIGLGGGRPNAWISS